MFEDMKKHSRINERINKLLEKDFHVDIKDIYDGTDGTYVKLQVKEKVKKKK